MPKIQSLPESNKKADKVKLRCKFIDKIYNMIRWNLNSNKNLESNFSAPSPLLLIIHSQIAWWFMKTAIMLPRVLHSNSQFWLFKSNIGWMVGCKGDFEPMQGFFIPFWSTITQDTYFLSDTWLHESCICKWLVYLKRIYDRWLRNSRKYSSHNLNHLNKYI